MKVKGKGDTLWKCTFSYFSVIYNPIDLQFGWLIVLDEGTRLIESSTSVGSRLTNLSRGWYMYDVTNTSRGGSRDWHVTSYHPRLRFVCLDSTLGLYYFSRTSLRYMHFKEKYVDNVLFNVAATLRRHGKRCALCCDVIITDVNVILTTRVLRGILVRVNTWNRNFRCVRIRWYGLFLTLVLDIALTVIF